MHCGILFKKKWQDFKLCEMNENASRKAFEWIIYLVTITHKKEYRDTNDEYINQEQFTLH